MNTRLLKLIVFSILFSASIQAQWVEVPFKGYNIQDLAAKDSLLYAIAYDGFYSSKDNGATWDSLGKFTDMPPQKILFLNDTIFVYSHWSVLAKASGEDKPCVFRSDDGGHTWKAVLSSFIGAGSMTIIGRTLFCTVEPKLLLKSTDYGETWDTLSLAQPAPDHVDYLFSYNEKLYAAQFYDGLYASSNDGANWKDISSGLQPLGFHDMFSNSKYIFLEKDTILYRSSDNGESWETLQIPLEPQLFVYSAIATDSLIFLSGFSKGTYDAKVYAGTVYSNRWKDISAGLPNGTSYGPKALAVKGNWAFLAAGNLLLKYDMSHLLAVENKPALINNYRLSQNYPNPFNPATTISYTIPKASHVELKVYDMLGREVQTLVNKELSAGTYKAEFNASRLPSGMYIYSIQAGEFRDSKKLLLVK
ncbi:MAG TPA: T9SS type A sorting domain-containing protein [Ignavibacteriales bacterium]|nr:T9SS type A sorting domain-containing protein [Ignavibacteriales bacterium]